ncbi:MAG TPA: hypothetical protein VMA36_13355 [Candidatus Limnocylindria bacterium]|jgi:hypothetical protein|nr:hypothetical protein [Candidatus Limnocylindria bacterium]
MDATVPFRLADGRYRALLRFRLDPSAPEHDVASLAQLLRLAPNGTDVRLAAPSRGVRAIEITGEGEGDVFVFATRVVDAIRGVGDLVIEEDTPAVRTPRATVVDAANWAFEPPGEPDAEAASEPEPRPSPARRWAGAARRALLGRIPR